MIRFTQVTRTKTFYPTRVQEMKISAMRPSPKFRDKSSRLDQGKEGIGGNIWRNILNVPKNCPPDKQKLGGDFSVQLFISSSYWEEIHFS